MATQSRRNLLKNGDRGAASASGTTMRAAKSEVSASPKLENRAYYC